MPTATGRAPAEAAARATSASPAARSSPSASIGRPASGTGAELISRLKRSSSRSTSRSPAAARTSSFTGAGCAAASTRPISSSAPIDGGPCPEAGAHEQLARAPRGPRGIARRTGGGRPTGSARSRSPHPCPPSCPSGAPMRRAEATRHPDQRNTPPDARCPWSWWWRTTPALRSVLVRGLAGGGLPLRGGGHRGAGCWSASPSSRPTRWWSTSASPTATAATCARRCAPRGDETPVLFLTARDALVDRLAGFEAGGDDYLTKPFSLDELVARLRALIRRAGRPAPSRVGGVELDPATHAMRCAGEQARLTPDRVPHPRGALRPAGRGRAAARAGAGRLAARRDRQRQHPRRVHRAPAAQAARRCRARRRSRPCTAWGTRSGEARPAAGTARAPAAGDRRGRRRGAGPAGRGVQRRARAGLSPTTPTRSSGRAPQAELATLTVIDGGVAVPTPIGRSPASTRPTWVFAGGRPLEAPPPDARIDAAARALAGGPERSMDVGDDIHLYALPVTDDGRRVGTVVAGHRARALQPHPDDRPDRVDRRSR